MNSERKTKQTIARIIHRSRALLSVVAFVALIWGLTLYQKAPSSGGPMSFVRLAFADVGGPDAFGYTLIDSDEPGGPVYNFEDISGTGTPIFLGYYQVSGAIPIGFTFNYYGTGYTQGYVSSNGFITALAGQISGCRCHTGERQLPDNAYPHGTIAGWWGNLYPSYPPGSGTIHYQTLGTPPNRRFIVQFKDVPHFWGGNRVTLQWKLFESTDVIEVHYKEAPSDGGTHLAGIENQDSTIGLNYYTGTSAIPDNTAVRYNPPKRLEVFLPLITKDAPPAGG